MVEKPRATESSRGNLVDDALGVSVTITELVHDHHAELYRYAYRLAGSRPDAEDLTQQTFLAAQQKWEQLRDATKARSWLFTILRNSFLKSCRKKTPHSAGDLEMDLGEVADASPDVDAVDGEAIQAALCELPDEFRIVLTMFYFEECSYKEIAQQLDLPPGTVMSRLSRAKGHLRRHLMKQ